MGIKKAQHVTTTDELVGRILLGDQTAEDELIRNYWKGLYFILNRRSRDPQLAADLAQDTFIVVIEKARSGKINSPESLVSFIRQVGINLMLAHYRKEKRRATDGFDSLDVKFPDSQTNISQQVELHDSISFVQQVIDEMPVARDKEILMSYYMQEESKRDICSRLNLNSLHFDRVLFRARTRLKQLIDFKLGGTSVL